MRSGRAGIILLELLGATVLVGTGSILVYTLMHRILAQHRTTLVQVHEWYRMRAGFLLMESLIALALMSILCVGIYSLVHTSMNALIASERRVSNEIALMQYATLIARDVARAAPYAAQWNCDNCIWPLEYIRTSKLSDTDVHAADLLREWVAYEITEGMCVRLSGVYDLEQARWLSVHRTILGQHQGIDRLEVCRSPDNQWVVGVRMYLRDGACHDIPSLFFPLRGGVLLAW